MEVLYLVQRPSRGTSHSKVAFKGSAAFIAAKFEVDRVATHATVTITSRSDVSSSIISAVSNA